MKLETRLQLSLMMLLEFFVWGSWYVTGPNYLATIGFTASDFGWMYSAGPIAGMIAPIFVGMIPIAFSRRSAYWESCTFSRGTDVRCHADHDLRTSQPQPDQSAVFLPYAGLFPYATLTNTIAMKCMTNPEREFPGIRVLGTIGWIAAGLAISCLHYDNSLYMFYLTVASGATLGLFSSACRTRRRPLPALSASARFSDSMRS